MQRGQHAPRAAAQPFTQDEIERRRETIIDPVEARWLATVDQVHVELEELGRQRRVEIDKLAAERDEWKRSATAEASRAAGLEAEINRLQQPGLTPPCRRSRS